MSIYIFVYTYGQRKGCVHRRTHRLHAPWKECLLCFSPCWGCPQWLDGLLCPYTKHLQECPERDEKKKNALFKFVIKLKLRSSLLPYFNPKYEWIDFSNKKKFKVGLEDLILIGWLLLANCCSHFYASNRLLDGRLFPSPRIGAYVTREEMLLQGQVNVFCLNIMRTHEFYLKISLINTAMFQQSAEKRF